MSNNLLTSRVMMGAALVGLVGAAGMYLYEQLYAEKRRAMLLREVARLDCQVASMRVELESLRELQKETQLRKQKQRKIRQKRAQKNAQAPNPNGDHVDGADVSYASDSEYFTDYQSVLGTDVEMDSEEFYDVHSDDDDTLRESLRNGTVPSENCSDEELSEKSDIQKPTVNTTT